MTEHDTQYTVPIMFTAPFVKEDPNRQKAFTKEMEEAAILCLAEANRKKPSLLRGSAEETECVAKLHYPLWAVPWNEKCAVADGLNLTTSTAPHSLVPGTHEFVEDLERSTASFDLFSKILEKHRRTFEGSPETEKVELGTLITDNQVLDALSQLLDGRETGNEPPETGGNFVPQTAERADAEAAAEKLLNEWQRVQTDIDGLKFAQKTLKQETLRHKEKASAELDQVWGIYEKRISETRKDVEKRVKSIEGERNKEAARAERANKTDVEELFTEERKARKKINELQHSLELILAQKRAQKRRYPKRSTSRIDNRASLAKERINQSKSELRRITDLQEETRTNGQQQLRQIEGKSQSLITNETERLTALERSRNTEVTKKTEAANEIQGLSQKIEAQISSLIAQKAKDADTLKAKTIPLKADEPLLVGVPFYVVQYRQQEKTRTDIYPPTTAASYEGIVRKIQKAIFSFSLENRIQLLLSPRSKELNRALFDNLGRSLPRNLALKDQIAKAAQSANLLLRPEFMGQLAVGLSELESEGWLSAKEKENIQNTITTK